MAFATGYLGDLQKVQGGENYEGDNGFVVGYGRGEFLTLTAGRFGRVVNGILQDLDGTAAPTIAGVTLRKTAGPVEGGATIDADVWTDVESKRYGLVTVDVKAGQTAPAKFGAVNASNAGDDDDGLALSTGGVATNAEFITEISPTVWLVFLKQA